MSVGRSHSGCHSPVRICSIDDKIEIDLLLPSCGDRMSVIKSYIQQVRSSTRLEWNFFTSSRAPVISGREYFTFMRDDPHVGGGLMAFSFGYFWSDVSRQCASSAFSVKTCHIPVIATLHTNIKCFSPFNFNQRET